MNDTPALTVKSGNSSVKLVLCDIDGCLNSGFSAPLDLPSLICITAQISRLRDQSTVVTLCTGRPPAYAQAIGQALGITAHMIVENGAALFDPLTGQYEPLSSPSDRSALDKFSATLMKHPEWSQRLRQEVGKQACLSLNGPEISYRSPTKIRALMEQLQALPDAERFDWSYSTSAIDITPKGISKAFGAQHLLDAMQLTWGQVAAIGDSNNDLPVLKRAIMGLCPANADAEVRKYATFTSSKPYAEGVTQLLNFVEEGM